MAKINTIGKNDFIKKVAAKTSMTIGEVKDILNTVAETAMEEVNAGNNVYFTDILTLKLHESKAHVKKNNFAKTKADEMINVPAKITLKADVTKSFKLIKVL